MNLTARMLTQSLSLVLALVSANALSNPLFTNSIVSTDIDFIQESDPDSFESLEYVGRDRREMPDKRNDELFDSNTFVFIAQFDDGDALEIWMHSSFETEKEATHYAQMVTGPLGKLPKFMRQRLDHVVIHKGDETAFGESEGHFFVLYSQNMDTRVTNHDLEETVFHETVHAALDSSWAKSKVWRSAQSKDNQFITQYGADNPKNEDLAESAIFAYTMLTNPGRLSRNVEIWLEENVPNRLMFFSTIFAN
jgi:hypothetical protein